MPSGAERPTGTAADAPAEVGPVAARGCVARTSGSWCLSLDLAATEVAEQLASALALGHGDAVGAFEHEPLTARAVRLVLPTAANRVLVEVDPHGAHGHARGPGAMPDPLGLVAL